MKKILKKSLVLMVAVFLLVLLTAPAVIYADTAYVEIVPEYGEIPALGQTIQYTAWSVDGVGNKLDVTDLATWTISAPNVASNDDNGQFTALEEGSTAVYATYESITGGTWLNVWKPSLWVYVGLPGETTGFNLGAWGCNGLSWALGVTGPTAYSASGTISSDDWYSYASAILSAGDYTATFSIGGTAQQVKTFSVYGYDASMDVSVGYAGETTTFTLNVTNSSGKTADFELYNDSGGGMVYSENGIPIDSDDWSYTITQTLAAGNCWAAFWIDNYAYWGDGYDFSVVNRGVPQPPVVEKATVKKAAVVKHGPAINEKPLSSYEKTASGFTTLFYNRILRRNPEKEGLDAWIARLENGEITGSDLIQQFIFGEECQKIISRYTNEEFITFLYKAIFNRAPGEDGLNAWLSRMADGMTKEEVVKQFGSSEEFAALCNLFGISPYPGFTETSK